MNLAEDHVWLNLWHGTTVERIGAEARVYLRAAVARRFPTVQLSEVWQCRTQGEHSRIGLACQALHVQALDVGESSYKYFGLQVV